MVRWRWSLGLLGLVPWSALAAPTLDYAAASGCPDGGRFSDEVSARVGKRAFGAEGSDAVVVRLEATEEGFHGVLTTSEGVRESRATTCGRVFAELVTATALALDDNPVALRDVPVPPARVRVEFPGKRYRKPKIAQVTSYGMGWGWTLTGPVEVTTVNLRDLCDSAPCEFELPPGDYELVAMARRRAPAREAFTFTAGEDAVLKARMPRPIGRGVGSGMATLGVLGLGVGYGLMVGAVGSDRPQSGDLGAWLVVGGGLMSLGAVPVYFSARGKLSRMRGRTEARGQR